MGKTYVSPSGTAKELQKIYVGNSNNVAQEIKRAYMGDANGIARMVFGPPYGPTPILPNEYQQVEYIYNSAKTAYINTGMKVSSSSKIVLDIQQTTVNRTCYNGAETGSGSTLKSLRFGINYNNSSDFCYQMTLSSAYIQAWGSATKRVLYTMDIKNKMLYIDNTSKSFSTIKYPDANLYLFSVNDDGTTNYGCIMKFYCLKRYTNNVLDRIFYPCYRKSDNAVGVYELFTNSFKTGSGSASIFAGPDYIGPLE